MYKRQQQTITLADGLPALTDPVYLDAMSQGGGGYSGDPLIHIDASATANFATAGIIVWTSDSTVRGFVVTGSTDEGIEVAGSSGHGAANDNVIENNWVGINFSGNAAANADNGILIVNDASNNIVRNNVVAGNTGNGIEIRGAGVDGNTVTGNIIGLSSDGLTRVANGVTGVSISDTATNNIIGGSLTSERNIIAGNNLHGVQIFDAGTTGNQILGNYIGVDINGTDSLVGNDGEGVYIHTGADANIVGAVGAGNVISANTDDGIRISDAGLTVIKGNIIGLEADGVTIAGNGQDCLLYTSPSPRD